MCAVFVKRLCNNLLLYTTCPGLPYRRYSLCDIQRVVDIIPVVAISGHAITHDTDSGES